MKRLIRVTVILVILVIIVGFSACTVTVTPHFVASHSVRVVNNNHSGTIFWKVNSTDFEETEHNTFEMRTINEGSTLELSIGNQFLSIVLNFPPLYGGTDEFNVDGDYTITIDTSGNLSVTPGV